MRFLIDEQLSRKLVRWFTDAGQRAEHVEEVLGQAASDADIVAYARRSGAVVVSKDSDFIDLLEGEPQPQLLWVRTGNIRTAALIACLQAEWPRIHAALTAGSRIVDLSQTV